MSKLNRLIDLAKKTGDRLIVHDPVTGRDVVLLTIDAYEDLIEKQKGEGVDEQVLIDRINRDISAWQSFIDSQQEATPEDAVGERPVVPTHWESAGQVMKERYQGFEAPQPAASAQPLAPPIEPEPQHIPYQTAESEAEKAIEDSAEEPIFFEEPLEEGRS